MSNIGNIVNNMIYYNIILNITVQNIKFNLEKIKLLNLI